VQKGLFSRVFITNPHLAKQILLRLFWHAAGDEEEATSWHSLVLKEFIEE